MWANIMNNVNRIVYTDEVIDVNNQKSTLVDALDVNIDGRYMYQYNDLGKQHIITGTSNINLLKNINDQIPSEIFDKSLIDMFRVHFISDDTKFIAKTTISIVTEGNSEPYIVILAWDKYKLFDDFPQYISQMLVNVDSIFENLSGNV